MPRPAILVVFDLLLARSAQIRSTPNGPRVSMRSRSTMTVRLSGGSGEAPRKPSPPAAVTAAARRSWDTNPMAAPTKGKRMQLWDGKTSAVQPARS
jgi:hypothetical protein